MSSDYVLHRFSHLQRFLFVHGRFVSDILFPRVFILILICFSSSSIHPFLAVSGDTQILAAAHIAMRFLFLLQKSRAAFHADMVRTVLRIHGTNTVRLHAAQLFQPRIHVDSAAHCRAVRKGFERTYGAVSSSRVCALPARLFSETLGLDSLALRLVVALSWFAAFLSLLFF